MRALPRIGIATVVSVVASSMSLGAPVSVQVSRGQASYASNCASCHGSTLDGGQGPALKGADFLAQWSGKTARNLYSLILSSMPASNPGSLPPRTVLDLAIYILSQNGVDVGSRARTSTDQLASIVIKH